MTRLAWTLGLALVYLAMVGAASAGDVLVALAVGSAASLVAPARGAAGPGRLRRVAALPWLALGIAWELARGSLKMLRLLVRRDQPPAVGTIELPFGERSAHAAALTALIASATPGSVLVHLDAERRVMLLNVIDASDPAQVRAELDAFYRRFQRHVLA